MLVSLAIRDFVLIDKLELSFGPGLSVLTGETGAGKSILLDALGLALGARADSALVRPGATTQASVAAEFTVAPNHPVLALLAEQDIAPPEPGEPLILRRTLAADGRSRAYVNDQPVGVTLLRTLGDALVEIESQFAAQGLADVATQRDALDAFGALADARSAVAGTYRAWRAAVSAYEAASAEAARSRTEEEFLRHAAAELGELDPQPGEEQDLASRRQLMMAGERLLEALDNARHALTEGKGADSRLAEASRILARMSDKAQGRFDAAIAALDSAADVAAEAIAAVERAGEAIDLDPNALSKAEERLFALRAAARKYKTDADALAKLRDEFAARLALLDDAGGLVAKRAAEADAARRAYIVAAEALSAARTKAAGKLDAAVMRELPALKLEKARFRTALARAAETGWAEHGIDTVAFEVATNPGMPPGPMGRIASGGELARFMLALKVALSHTGAASTLVFDEVDSGVGGATAAAVGERLVRLARKLQILVVTHSPQVAACAKQHLRVVKKTRAGAASTAVELLDDPARREEIARMLAGAKVTEAARAAADSLMARERP
jgi:DNA repair protein RecN (Recombination protein N)